MFDLVSIAVRKHNELLLNNKYYYLLPILTSNNMHQIIIVVILCTLTLVAASESHHHGPFLEIEELLRDKWETFKETFSKYYGNTHEEERRYKIYRKNFIEIVKHNELYRTNKSTFELELNEFSDQTDDEFIKKLAGLEVEPDSDLFTSFNEAIVFETTDELPTYVNWTERGAVTPVKNQHHCGACWAFSTTGSIEAQYFLKHGKLVAFSEQNLIDCSDSYYNHGCHGGLMEKAFRYIHDHGITTEQEYPYEHNKGTCRFLDSESKTKIRHFYRIVPGNEAQLQYAVAKFGTVSIGLEVSFHFKHYKRGVYYEERCRPHLNHAVLVTGYGVDDGTDYWMVKNSWGPRWGENGYIKMARNKNDNCGIAMNAVFPIL